MDRQLLTGEKGIGIEFKDYCRWEREKGERLVAVGSDLWTGEKDGVT